MQFKACKSIKSDNLSDIWSDTFCYIRFIRTDYMSIRIVYVLCIEDLAPLIRYIWGIHLIHSTKEDLNPWGFLNFMRCKYILFNSWIYSRSANQFWSMKFSVFLKKCCRQQDNCVNSWKSIFQDNSQLQGYGYG